MRKLVLTAMISLLAVPAFAADAPTTDEQKALYAIGVFQARQLGTFNLTPQEFEIVQQGFADGAPGKQPKIDVDAYGPKVQELARSRRAALEKKGATTGDAYRAKAAKTKGAVKTASGLIYIPEREGKGHAPKPTDTVIVNYRGTLVDGKEFSGTMQDNKPVEYKLNTVLKCWTEGLQLMKPGGKATLVCPPELAYGKQGSGFVIPPNATLVFQIELVGVKK